MVVIMMVLAITMTGCGGKKEVDTSHLGNTNGDNQTGDTDASAKNAAPITYTVFIGAPDQQLTKNNKIMALIEEHFGVTFEFEYLVGDLDQKTGVMIASGEYPDIIVSNNTQDFINAGAYRPLEEYMSKDKTPHLYNHFEPYMNKIKADDGHIYVLPNYGRYYNDYIITDYVGPAFWIQKEVLKEFNYPEVKTLDAYFDLIEAYMDKYPEIDGQPTIGFEALSFDWRSFCLKNPPAHLSGYPNDGGVVVDPETHIAEVFCNTDKAKPYYKKLNEAYNKGIIKADTFIQNYDEYLARLSTGAVLGMFDQGWQFAAARDSLIAQGKIERTWAPLAITYDESITPYYLDRGALNIDRGFGISNQCKDPERFIQLVDALLTEDWQKILSWGIEGEDYMVDEKGMFYRTEEQRLNQEDTAWKLANKGGQFFEQLPKLEGTFSDGNAFSPGSQPYEYRSALKEIDIELLDAYGVDYISELLGRAPENRKDYPAWQIPLGDGTDAAVAEQQLHETQLRYIPQLILGSPDKFDSGWEDYLDKFKSIDIEAYESLINEGIQERLKEW